MQLLPVLSSPTVSRPQGQSRSLRNSKQSLRFNAKWQLRLSVLTAFVAALVLYAANHYAPLRYKVLSSLPSRRNAGTRVEMQAPYGGLLPRRVTVRNATSLSGTEILARPFARRIIVSEKSKLIFCPIPKAACSNWKYLIRKFEGCDDYFDMSKAHLPELTGLRYLTDYSPHEVQILLSDPSFFKFAFVRDPYMRAVSCYMDKFQSYNDAYMRTEYRKFLGQLYDWRYARSLDIYDPSSRPSFSAFVDELAKQDPMAMNEHWMPQTLLCGFGDMPYDFVGRMESLNEDVDYVFQKIGRPNETFPTHADIGFPPSSTGSTRAVADDLYALETMIKIRVIYDVDFNSKLGETLRTRRTPRPL
jgi:Sulfotransferase family